MSWRIENVNPFALLNELPNGWAQTCFLRPPRDLPTPCLLAVLEHVHRVLRDDGTLWLSFPGRGTCPQELRRVEQAGWLRPERCERHRGSVIGRGVLTLFSKQREFHFDARPPSLNSTFFPRHDEVCPTRPRDRRRADCRQARRAWCVPGTAGTDSFSANVIEQCLRSSTSPRACGVCGAPWRRLPGVNDGGGGWRPGCSHLNDRGRCVVLDPFCAAAEIGVLAVRAGHSYLGVEPNLGTALRARRRLEVLEREARR
jgi:hypothetical protein